MAEVLSESLRRERREEKIHQQQHKQQIGHTHREKKGEQKETHAHTYHSLSLIAIKNELRTREPSVEQTHAAKPHRTDRHTNKHAEHNEGIYHALTLTLLSLLLFVSPVPFVVVCVLCRAHCVVGVVLSLSRVSPSPLSLGTKAALKQFDNNMAGIFDRKSFYEGTLHIQTTNTKTGGGGQTTGERERSGVRQTTQPPE